LASKVVLKHGTQVSDISGGVSNRNLSITLVIAVGLDIASGGQDVGRSGRAISSGQDFVADENTSSVIVLLEFIKYFLETIKLSLVPMGLRL